MKRVVVVGLVLVGMLMVSSSEAMAQEKIAYLCDLGPIGQGNNSVCVADLDGSNVVILPNPSGVEYLGVGQPYLDVTADGTEVILQANGSIYRLPVNGSPATSVPFSPPPNTYGAIALFTLPPNVTSLTPTNQTITVFLLGMIASALIMRGRQGTAEQT